MITITIPWYFVIVIFVLSPLFMWRYENLETIELGIFVWAFEGEEMSDWRKRRKHAWMTVCGVRLLIDQNSQKAGNLMGPAELAFGFLFWRNPDSYPSCVLKTNHLCVLFVSVSVTFLLYASGKNFWLSIIQWTLNSGHLMGLEKKMEGKGFLFLFPFPIFLCSSYLLQLYLWAFFDDGWQIKTFLWVTPLDSLSLFPSYKIRQVF